ncbi:hypothetical protein F511_36156 [Dorcoceras hygrometricum]|uniref:Uncharacterized protein n=1 Tax=Dorcoceras hygrometricum TaxID=472368 RepID=A0A2Z7CGF3_9LAMI|nr:hypothetical protein F511_36156 [Dorcoceras hygrometricum]
MREPLRNTAAGSALPCAALDDRWWPPRAFLLPTFAPPHSARLLRAMADAATSCCVHDLRTSSMERRACRGRVRPCGARDFVDGGTAVAGRRSGDVVKAGSISSRFWFGPVPGSPWSFRAGTRCRARF